ncbi:MAG: C-terminal binding protein [Clostridia bacterium]|nr:C-terminal binding protein [Clostridia bacterium]
MKYKVVLTEADLSGGWAIEEKMLADADAELVVLNSTDPDIIVEAASDADALVVSYASIDADVISKLKKCKSVSKLGIGVNNIDVEAATKAGIRVMNAPSYCIEEVSDMIVAHTLSLTRGVPFYWNNIRNGKWSREGCNTAVRLCGKVFGFMGYGKIARRTAEKIRAFGMKIVAYDPYLTKEAAAAAGAELMELDDMLACADVISMNLPLTEETTGILNKEFFRKMKSSAVLINTARGPMLNEKDFCEAILSGEIAGAGLDVLCKEAYDPENPIFNLPNVVITPHAAFYSPEAILDLRDEVFTDVVRVLKGEEPLYQLNRKK